MAKTKQFKIKVRRDAPDTVAHGNFSAEKAGGHYTTDNARFAAWPRGPRPKRRRRMLR